MNRTIRYGNAQVPVITRDWLTSERTPYRKTYRLQPGQHWSEAPISNSQFEFYVASADGHVPVGAVITRELVDQGAKWAYFTEMWGGRLVLVNSKLVCEPVSGEVARLLEQFRAVRDGRLGGLPDVIAGFPRGRIVLREAKTPRSSDRLRPNQHSFADAARSVLGKSLDLAVVEWGGTHKDQAN